MRRATGLAAWIAIGHPRYRPLLAELLGLAGLAAGLIIVVPLTSRDRKVPLHVAIDPPEGGLRARSYAKCEDVRSISTERLTECWGRVAALTMRDVEDRLRIVMGL